MSARVWWSCAESRRPRRSDNTAFQLQIAMAGFVPAITLLGPAGRCQTRGDGRPVSGRARRASRIEDHAIAGGNMRRKCRIIGHKTVEYSLCGPLETLV